MKTLKYLALAGMLAMFFPIASVASTKTAKEQKKNVAVADQVLLDGHTLKPGNYQVEWNGNGPTAQVKFMQFGKTVLTVPARVAQLHQKAPYDAVIENTTKNGAKTISEIEWSHQREALRFGTHASTTHNRKRAS